MLRGALRYDIIRYVLFNAEMPCNTICYVMFCDTMLYDVIRFVLFYVALPCALIGSAIGVWAEG